MLFPGLHPHHSTFPHKWLPQIIIQLKQFSASISQTDLIHHSNDTNGAKPLSLSFPQRKNAAKAICRTGKQRGERNGVVFVQQDVGE